MKMEFSIPYFQYVLREQAAGRHEFDRHVIGDGQPEKDDGLRAVMSVGQIAFHVKYTVDGKARYFQLGTFPDTSIEDARMMTKAVLSSAAAGIDPLEEMHVRLRRELLVRGDSGGRA